MLQKDHCFYLISVIDTSVINEVAICHKAWNLLSFVVLNSMKLIVDMIISLLWFWFPYMIYRDKIKKIKTSYYTYIFDNDFSNFYNYFFTK